MNHSPDSNIYQVAGLDDRARGFNRQATVTCMGNRFQAVFVYEQFRMVAEHEDSETGAIHRLIRQLQMAGYRELRSRLHFRGEAYLGNQELWTEHADLPEETFWTKLLSWIRPWNRA